MSFTINAIDILCHVVTVVVMPNKPMHLPQQARLTIRIDEDIAKALKHRAIDQETSVNQIIVKLITDYMAKKSKK